MTNNCPLYNVPVQSIPTRQHLHPDKSVQADKLKTNYCLSVLARYHHSNYRKSCLKSNFKGND